MTTINGLSLPKLTNHDPDSPSIHRRLGPAIAMAGFVLVVVTAIVNWASIGDVGDSAAVAETSLWAGGVGILGLATIKVAIAVVLLGIVLRLWIRVDSIRYALPNLHARPDAPEVHSTDRRVTTSTGVPDSLPIHKMATRLWKPMVGMGAMAVGLGAVLRIVGAGETGGTEAFRRLAAWGIGIEFLGEALLLSGVAFLLGTILASLRQGGGEVQASVGATVKLPQMPATGKAFVALMMLGLIVGIGQFIASIALATRADDPAGYAELAAFLGPLREFSLGLILAGIVLALATIGTVLAFQFDRVRELARNN